MKNKITLLAFGICIVLIIVILIYGINIFGFEILSISQLMDKNSELEGKINTASTLTAIDYPETIANLEETYEKHEVEKRKYEQLVDLKHGSKKEIYETKQYDVGYLWKKIGKYATSRKLSMAIDVQKAAGKDLYDLKFVISGRYSNTIQFISDVENDSDLYFRIYDFKMIPAQEDGQYVTSNFTVKNVNIDPETTISTTTSNITTDDTSDINENTTVDEESKMETE